MGYKSILVHACEAQAAESRYRLAADIALAEQARLVGAAMSGVREFMLRYAAAAAIAPLGLGDLAFMTENAEAELAAFVRSVRARGVIDVHTRLSEDSAASALPLAARYCDLLLVGQTISPDALIADARTLARHLLVYAPCPVLVAPAVSTSGRTNTSNHAGTCLPRHALIAWDGSMEASRAVRAALPLLQRAATVAALSFQPYKYVADGDGLGDALADYLACHGIDVEVMAPTPSEDVGRDLLALADARGADLIVMGSYSHSRFREIVLGGATRTVLAEATVPVLMAH